MQKFNNFVLEANKKFKLADHIAYVTYPLLKETKLLLTILENTNKSLILALNAYLYYDYSLVQYTYHLMYIYHIYILIFLSYLGSLKPK